MTILVFILLFAFMTTLHLAFAAPPKIQNGYVTQCTNTFWGDDGPIKSQKCCTKYYQNGQQVGIEACRSVCYSKNFADGLPVERKCTKDELISTVDPKITNDDAGGLPVNPDIK